jgi:hypothetical protein
MLPDDTSLCQVEIQRGDKSKYKTTTALNDSMSSASHAMRPLCFVCKQDFMRLYQAEMLMEIQVGGEAPPPRLTEWLRGYAIKSLNDKVNYSLTGRNEPAWHRRWHMLFQIFVICNLLPL